jgi:hypothetical protein
MARLKGPEALPVLSTSVVPSSVLCPLSASPKYINTNVPKNTMSKQLGEGQYEEVRLRGARYG